MGGEDFRSDEEFQADKRLKNILKEAIRELLPEIVAAFKENRPSEMEKAGGDPRPNQ